MVGESENKDARSGGSDESGDEPHANDAAAAESGASPDAIAKRVAALGEEDENDKIARLEEEKLRERRERMRTRGKRGLEAAASKKLREIGTKPKRKKVSEAADESTPADAADPLLEKTLQLGAWVRKNSRVAGIAGLVVAAVVMGVGIKNYLTRSHEEAASLELAKALADEHGRIAAATPSPEDTDEDPGPSFKTPEERRSAALAKYNAVAHGYGGTGAAYLAQLGAASLLLDEGDGKGALEGYDAVARSPLAVQDPQVRGRALEGRGLAIESMALAVDDDAQKKARLREAMNAYQELAKAGIKGFDELGMYHEARMLELLGEKDKAKDAFKVLYDRTTKPGDNHPFPYLEALAEEHVRALDPGLLPAKRPGELGGANGTSMSEAQMKQLEEMIKKRSQSGGKKK